MSSCSQQSAVELEQLGDTKYHKTWWNWNNLHMAFRPYQERFIPWARQQCPHRQMVSWTAVTLCTKKTWTEIEGDLLISEIVSSLTFDAGSQVLSALPPHLSHTVHEPFMKQYWGFFLNLQNSLFFSCIFFLFPLLPSSLKEDLLLSFTHSIIHYMRSLKSKLLLILRNLAWHRTMCDICSPPSFSRDDK